MSKFARPEGQHKRRMRSESSRTEAGHYQAVAPSDTLTIQHVSDYQYELRRVSNLTTMRSIAGKSRSDYRLDKLTNRTNWWSLQWADKKPRGPAINLMPADGEGEKLVNSKIALLATAALISVSEASAAQAQDAGSPTRSNGSSDQTVEDIVVTAQRTSQNLQDVPISITAVTSNALARQGVNDTQTLTQSIPGVDISHVSNGATPFIRGVGNPNAVVGNESPVTIYVDGVYHPSAQGGIFSFNNIERIEVLKGPQGTLFGRNATGGVIQVITKDPSRTPQMAGSIGYGNFDTIQGDLYASTGLTRNLAIDFAAYVTDQGVGWGRNLTTGAEIFKTKEVALRSKLLWDLGERTRLRFAIDYDRVRSDVGLNLGFAPGSVGVDGVTTFSGFYNSRSNPPDNATNKQVGGSVQIDHDLEWARFVSITSYRQLHNEVPYDQDGTPLDIVVVPEISQHQRTVTQELQLQSPTSSKISWIIGAYYFYDKAGYDGLTLKGAAAAPFSYVRIVAFQRTNSYAGFAQMTYPILNTTRITAGIRYTSDKRKIDGSTDLGGAALLTNSQEKTFGKLTWRLSLDHDFTPDILGYASYNRGFKSGLFNTISYGDPAVNPEVLDAYEIGLKTQLFNHRLRFNIAAFRYDYTNIQLTRLVAGAPLTLNAASARVKGVDFDFEARLSTILSLTGGLAYLDGKYRSFPNAPLFTPQPTGGNLLTATDASGNRMVRAPKLTYNIGPSAQFETDVGTFHVNLLYYHSSGFYWNPDNRLQQPSYDIVNGLVSWTSNSNRYGVKLWVRNLLDKKYYSYAEEQTLGDNTSPAAPRTYGISLSVNFR